MGALERNGLQDTFTFIYSGSTFGKHKVINKWLRIENIHTEKVVYVGDEIRDIDAAKKVVLLCKGWRIRTLDPVF